MNPNMNPNMNNWGYPQYPVQHPMFSTLYQQQMLTQHQQPTKSDAITAKFYLQFSSEHETRRLKIKKDINFDGLVDVIQSYIAPFSENLRIHKLQYLDDESEWVNFNNDIEWKDCLKQMMAKKTGKIVKVKIVTQKKKNKKKKKKKEKVVVVEKKEVFEIEKKEKVEVEEPEKEETEKEGVVHEHKCDVCKNMIKGTRYNCSTRKDYDVCEQCFNKRNEFGLENDGWNVYDQPKVLAYTIPGKMAVTAMPTPRKKEKVDEKMTSSLDGGKDKNKEKVAEEVTDEDIANLDDETSGKLKLLREMGFHDNKKSLVLLRANNGDLQSVVREHLNV